MNPFFSIIIPTFNSESTIKSAIESIINQSYTNYEIVIVDGLSTDKTLELLIGYINEKIKIASEKDNGIYDAMNKGITISKGEWLIFLGSDDKLYSNHVLQDVARIIEAEDKYQVLYGNVYSTRFNGFYDGEFDENKIFYKNICHQSVFFRKTVFQLIGQFELKYKAHSDWHHNMKWFLNKLIKNKYINLIIADYADGGYSSTHGDILFSEDKNMHYLKCSASMGNQKFKRAIWVTELKKSVKHFDVFKLISLIKQTFKLI